MVGVPICMDLDTLLVDSVGRDHFKVGGGWGGVGWGGVQVADDDGRQEECY